MIPSPIHKALSTIRRHQVLHLLMGGQACVLYGAAEFSRDLDLMLLPDPENLDHLREALRELDAEVIAIPPFRNQHLDEGLAVHFRCQSPDVQGLRIDIMTRMRGVDDFTALWDRRTTLELGDEIMDLLSLPDLVAAKKTQRDKDWPMIRRLLDVSYMTHRQTPTPQRLTFWLRELRSPELLLEVAGDQPEKVSELLAQRPLLALATPDGLTTGALARAIRDEEDSQRAADSAYWRPLRERLAQLRRAARLSRSGPDK